MSEAMEQIEAARPRRFKPYPEYRDSDVEWLDVIPAAWKKSRLRFLVETNPSKGEVRYADPEIEVSFVPMETVGEYGGLELENTKPLSVVSDGYTYFREGDVVVAKITPCFENGKGALATGLTNGIAFGTTELHVLRPSEQLDTRYLFYVTVSDHFRRLGAAAMYGAGGQKRVPDDFVRNLYHPLPSLSEQQCIAAFLDHESAKIDALVAKKEQLIRLLQEKRNALINRAVTRGLDPSAPMKQSGVEWLGKIPAHWDVRRIAMVVDKITNGYVGPTRDILVDSGVPYLQSLHIKNGQIEFDRKHYFVTSDWSEQHPKSILSEGDVLIVQTGDIGQNCAVPAAFDGANCHALIILRLKADMGAGAYLSLLLQSAYGQNALKRSQTGALHPHLECGHVREIPIVLPPPEEQSTIVRELKKQVRTVDTLQALVRDAVDRLKEYRTALISTAVTGKIDVREEAI